MNPSAAASSLSACLARLAALLLVLCLSLPALAQSTNGPTEVEGPDYARWEATAGLAENLLANPSTPDTVLSNLRSEVVAFRSEFIATQNAHRDRIDALREQIEGLGPPPAEGEVEADEIVARRAELNERLATRQAPLLAASEAQRRADVIVRAIDRVMRERQADALLSLWPSPLNPANWSAGANAVISSGLTLMGEAHNAWLHPNWYQSFRSDLPLFLGTLALSVLLLTRGRALAVRLTLRLLDSAAILRGREAAAYFVSLAQLAMPLAGLWLLSQAILLSQLTGPTIEALAAVLVPAGMAIYAARWLSLQVFPISQNVDVPLRLDDSERRQGRVLAPVFGLVYALYLLYEPFIQPDAQSEAARAVVIFPIVVLASVILYRMGRLLMRHKRHLARTETDPPESDSLFDRLVPIAGKLLVIVAVAATAIGAVGYIPAAVQLVFSTLGSLALIAFVIVVHGLIVAIYAAIVGDAAAASRALVPALAGLLLALASMPALAMIWGLRATEILEVWARFQAGFALGETRISPANILSFLLAFAIGYVITRAVQMMLSQSVLPKTTMERGAQKAVVSGVGYIGIFAAALIAFSTAGIDLSGLAIVAGALSVGIGFGLQNIVSNFVSGVILLVERPVSEGDWVEVGTTMGTVSRISVRSTVIETFDRTEVIVPNSDLISGTVTNYTKSNTTGRVIIPVGVAYGTDTRRVEKILREIIEAQPIVSLSPPPTVLFQRFGADSLEFEIRAILRDVNFSLRVKSEVNHEIARRFVEEGIEIPFAQRDIWLRNPEVLTGRPASEPAAPPPAETDPEPQPPPDPELEFDGTDSPPEAEDSGR
ncbi:DUF3772 domain-containing protein [Pararhodobacter sp. SW119]|uniref:DUF3772 domain-containing protein n=1 Tax=Pararhodobacter sp. SW119 TaxID=2780075 RepID=UPI001ADFC22A|nr:DUF3772 domain-containing protein [Pararhodobacter sp. SW119]